ncbi:MAG: hypothetical protein NVSMB5_10060 [Candidatus Velthaea sp.]
MNESDPNSAPHPPYEELRSALGEHPEGHAALDDLHASLHAPAPEPEHVHTHVERLRGIPEIEARIALWYESPRTQNWLKILNDAGL